MGITIQLGLVVESRVSINSYIEEGARKMFQETPSTLVEGGSPFSDRFASADPYALVISKRVV